MTTSRSCPRNRGSRPRSPRSSEARDDRDSRHPYGRAAIAASGVARLSSVARVDGDASEPALSDTPVENHCVTAAASAVGTDRTLKSAAGTVRVGSANEVNSPASASCRIDTIVSTSSLGNPRSGSSATAAAQVAECEGVRNSDLSSQYVGERALALHGGRCPPDGSGRSRAPSSNRSRWRDRTSASACGPSSRTQPGPSRCPSVRRRPRGA